MTSSHSDTATDGHSPDGNGDHGAAPGSRAQAPLSEVDRVFRDAVAIRHLLESLEEDDHAMRSRLLLARDEVRVRAARLWSDRGWRPITDSR